MPYSAGTVFLQVVMSYEGVQEQNKQQARDIAQALDKGLDEGTKSGAAKAKKNIDDILGKGAEESGQKHAEKYAGKFRTELGNSLKNLSREIEPIQLQTDDSKILASFERAKAEAKSLSKIKITPGMDTSEIEARAAHIRNLLSNIDKDANVRVKMDIGAATSQVDRLDKALEKLRHVDISPDIDTAQVERKVGALERILKEKLGSASEALGDGVNKELDKIKVQMRTLQNKQLGVDVSADDALKELANVRHQLEFISALDPDIQVHVDAKAALAELRGVETAIKKLDGKNVRPNVKPPSDDARKKLSLLDQLMVKLGVDGRDVANSFRFFSFAALAAAGAGAALIPIVAALTGGFIALGVALGGLIIGGALLAAGFSGIGTAVSALNDQQDSAAKDAESNAKKMRNAAQSVEDAERSLKRARESSAQAAKDAAQGVADAQEQATRALETALRRQEDAQKRVNDSIQDTVQAQRDLVEARRQAAEDLEDLENKRRHNNLDERQAVIDLFNATVQDTAAQQDPGATNLEKEQSSITLGEAKLRLEEIRKQGKELQQQGKQGIDNSDKVKTAQDRVTQSLEAQKDAQRDLRDADKELTRTRLDNARSIQDALESQRRTQADSAQSVEDAQRNLTRSQQDYRDALKETSDIGSSSFQKVEEAMGKLSPAGRDFALFLHGLRDDFFEIRSIIQEGLLPGVQKAIQILIDTYGPDFKSFVGEVAKLMGTLAVDGAKVFTSPAWKTFFSTMAELSPKVIALFFRTLTNWLTIFANVGTLFAPVALQISEFILKISESILKWVESADGQKTIQDFIGYLAKIGPEVWQFVAALAGAFFNLAKSLAPYGEKILGVLTGFLEWIAGMDPKTLGAVVVGILGIVFAFQLMAGIISLLSIIAGSTLGPIVLAIFLVVAALVYFYETNENVRKILDFVWKTLVTLIQWAFPIWRDSIAALAALVVWLGTQVDYAWKTWIWPFLQAFGSAIYDFWTKTAWPILTALGALFGEIFGDIGWAWKNVLWPVLKALGTVVYDIFVIGVTPIIRGLKALFEVAFTGIKAVWDTVLSPVFKAIASALGLDDQMKENGGGLVGAFKTALGFIKTMWDGLKDIAKGPIDFVVGTVINKGLIAGFNSLVGSLPGVKAIDPIPWPPPGFQTGGITDNVYGVRPGYMPGRDNQIIAVGGGEAILRPELTRALGSDWVHAANKRARRSGVQGARDFLQGFKSGGVVEPHGGGGNVGDFDRTTWKGHRFNYRTIRMLQAAERLAGQAIRVTQGSYSTSVSASGSTHAGGGAFDLGWPGGLLGQALVTALRIVGTASWHRDPSQGPWGHHIHGIAIGDPTASPAAQRQVQDYFNGGNGLGGRDDGPQVAKDPSLLDKIGGGLSNIAGIIGEALSNPAEWLMGKISGQLEKVTKDWGDNQLTQIVKGIPQKLAEGLASLIGFGGNDSPVNETGLKGMVQNLASNFGWAGNQWSALDWLIQHESSWNPNAKNPSSSAYGLFQFLDGTWSPYGAKTSDPALQAQYGLQYIQDRYGSPENAKAFWQDHGWYSDGGVVPDNGTMMYDNGGYIPPGVTSVVNLTGKPEPVFTASQFEGMKRGGGAGSGFTYSPTFNESDLTAGDVADDLVFTMTRLEQGVIR